MLGYVHVKNATPQSTMKKWIDSATWQPVPGGLTSDKEYMSNMRRFQDPDDEWTRLMLFGSIGANNVGRSEEKAAKRQALHDITKSCSLASCFRHIIIEPGLALLRIIIIICTRPRLARLQSAACRSPPGGAETLRN